MLINNFSSPRKIAIIHDWFLEKSIGGAEFVTKVLDKTLTKEFKQPDLYSLVESLNNYHSVKKNQRYWHYRSHFATRQEQKKVPIVQKT